MEKKTIGSFIAALRRANGLTQAELAEKLNVSDKTISRWERDESSPDLTLIPVLSEIFSVTADELLRGERLAPESFHIQSDKRNKQLKCITGNTKIKFTTRSIISIGLSLIGLTGAAIANFGFARGIIGFFISLAFIIAAIICETVFTILAFSSINAPEFDEEAINECKKSIFKTACFTFYSIIIIFSFTLPLALNIGFGFDGNLGLTWKRWLTYGFIFSAVASVICLIINIFTNRFAIAKGIFSVNENELKIIKNKSILTAKSLAVLTVLLAVTALTQLIFNTAASARTLSEKLVFDNYEDFIQFMETPAEDESFAEMTFVFSEPHDSEIEEDNEEYNKEYLYDAEGRVLCEYIYRNFSVSIIEASESEDLLPITVYTDKDIIKGNQKLNQINSWLGMSYSIELITVAIIYFIKLKKIK